MTRSEALEAHRQRLIKVIADLKTENKLLCAENQRLWDVLKDAFYESYTKARSRAGGEEK